MGSRSLRTAKSTRNGGRPFTPPDILTTTDVVSQHQSHFLATINNFATLKSQPPASTFLCEQTTIHLLQRIQHTLFPLTTSIDRLPTLPLELTLHISARLRIWSIASPLLRSSTRTSLGDINTSKRGQSEIVRSPSGMGRRSRELVGWKGAWGTAAADIVCRWAAMERRRRHTQSCSHERKAQEAQVERGGL